MSSSALAFHPIKIQTVAMVTQALTVWCIQVDEIRLNEPWHDKIGFCSYENKDKGQLWRNCTADLCLCFRFKGRIKSLPHKFEISSLLPQSVTVQAILCWTPSESPKTDFLATWPKCVYITLA